MSAKAKPYKRAVTRNGRLFSPCRHCGESGFDAYMLQVDLWRMVLPPGVEPGYSAGFVCLRCALESIDRPLCREDITGCTDDQYPTLSRAGELEIEIRLPKRGSRRKTHAIHLMAWGPEADDPVSEIVTQYDWLLDRLALQASGVIVRQNYMDGAPLTIGRITL